MEALKEERLDDDRLENLRERRRQLTSDFAPAPALRLPADSAAANRPKPFQDFRPPPVLHRPGLERAAPTTEPSRPPAQSQMSQDSTMYGSSLGNSTQEGVSWSSPDSKRKRDEDDELTTTASTAAKRRVVAESASTARGTAPPARKFIRLQSTK